MEREVLSTSITITLRFINVLNQFFSDWKQHEFIKESNFGCDGARLPFKDLFSLFSYLLSSFRSAGGSPLRFAVAIIHQTPIIRRNTSEFETESKIWGFWSVPVPRTLIIDHFLKDPTWDRWKSERSSKLYDIWGVHDHYLFCLTFTLSGKGRKTNCRLHQIHLSATDLVTLLSITSCPYVPRAKDAFKERNSKFILQDIRHLVLSFFYEVHSK